MVISDERETLCPCALPSAAPLGGPWAMALLAHCLVPSSPGDVGASELVPHPGWREPAPLPGTQESAQCCTRRKACLTDGI